MRFIRHGAAMLLLAILTMQASHASAQPMRSDDGGRAARFVGNIGANAADVALQFVGAGNVTGTPGPWCAAFASLMLSKTGHRPLANRMASSALGYGPRTGAPRRGDLVVMNHAGHVGIFLGFAKGGVRIVSGNWSHHVSIALVSRNSITAFVHV